MRDPLPKHPEQDLRSEYLWRCASCDQLSRTRDMLDLTEKREGHDTKLNEVKHICPTEDCFQDEWTLVAVKEDG